MNSLGIALSALALGLALPAPAEAKSERTIPQAQPSGSDESEQAFPGGVTARFGINYSTIPFYRPLKLDLYLPPEAKRPSGGVPLVLFMHGGGWAGGDRRNIFGRGDFATTFALLASEGFAVASIDYRLSGEAPYPAQLQDARAALRFLKAHATDYGIDSTRSAAWGTSAGGQLAAALAVSCGDTSFDPKPEPAGSECVQAAVPWFGTFDMAALFDFEGFPSFYLEALLGCRKGQCSQGTLDRASPVKQVDASDPPMLLVHGTGDTLVPTEQTRAFEAKLKAAGVPVEALYVEGANHGLRQPTPEASQAAFAKALNATIDFFHARLGVPGG